DESTVLGQVDEINKEIQRLKSEQDQKDVVDVVLIYYQGQVRDDDQGRRWLLTRRNILLPNDPVDRHGIGVHRLPTIQGVPLLVLNARGPKEVARGTGLGTSSTLAQLAYFYQERKDAKTVDADLLPMLGDALAKHGGRIGSAVDFLSNELK